MCSKIVVMIATLSLLLIPIAARGQFHVSKEDNVGVGTDEPKTKLDVLTGTENQVGLRVRQKNYYYAASFDVTNGGAGVHIKAGQRSLDDRLFAINNDGKNDGNVFIVNHNGNVGIGTVSPKHPLQMSSGAYVSKGGVWTNASSRSLKKDIKILRSDSAFEIFHELEPVRFRYKNEAGQEYLGFISEEVPADVATEDRKGLSAMNLVAVLTKVVQSQQTRIDRLEARLATLEQ